MNCFTFEIQFTCLLTSFLYNVGLLFTYILHRVTSLERLSLAESNYVRPKIIGSIWNVRSIIAPIWFPKSIFSVKNEPNISYFFYSSLNSAKLSCSSEVTLILLHIMKKAVQNPSLISWAMIDDITRFLTCNNISLPRPGVSNFFCIKEYQSLCITFFVNCNS